MKGERGPTRRRSAAKLVVRAPILTSKWESGFYNPPWASMITFNA